MSTNNSRTVEVLRATLLELEQSCGLAAGDPALAQLRSILLRRIADLEADQATPSLLAESTPQNTIDITQLDKKL